MRTLAKIVAAAAVIAGPAFAQTSHGGHGGHGAMPTTGSAPAGAMDPAAMQKLMGDMMPAPTDPVSTREFKAADMKMMHDMAVPYTGDPDVDLRTKMIPHHQGAIDMARVALRHAKDPETKRMAQKIIDDQEREISEMRDWLKKRGK